MEIEIIAITALKFSDRRMILHRNMSVMSPMTKLVKR